MQIRITDNSWSSQSAFSYPMIPIAVIVITNIKNTFNTLFSYDAFLHYCFISCLFLVDDVRPLAVLASLLS